MLGAASAFVLMAAMTVGTMIAVPAGGSTASLITALWSLVLVALSRSLFLLVRRGGARADLALAEVERARGDLQVAAALRSDQLAFTTGLHDTAAATLLMVGLGQVKDREMMSDRARRDLEVLQVGHAGEQDAESDLGEKLEEGNSSAAHHGARVMPVFRSGSGIGRGRAGRCGHRGRQQRRTAQRRRCRRDPCAGLRKRRPHRDRGPRRRFRCPRRRGLRGGEFATRSTRGWSRSAERPPSGPLRVPAPSWNWTGPVPDLIGDRPSAEAFLRGLRIAVLVIGSTVLFTFSMVRSIPLYNPLWPQLVAFSTLAAVSVTEIVLVTRRAPWGAWRWPAVACVLSASALSTFSLPDGAVTTASDWAFGTVGWFGLILLLDQPLVFLVGFLVAQERIQVTAVIASNATGLAEVLNLITGSLGPIGFPLACGIAAAVLKQLAGTAERAAREAADIRTADVMAAQRHAQRARQYCRSGRRGDATAARTGRPQSGPRRQRRSTRLCDRGRAGCGDCSPRRTSSRHL